MPRQYGLPYKGSKSKIAAELFRCFPKRDNFYDLFEWCARQTEPVFISSYDMPEEKFYCVKKLIHRSTLCTTANLKVVEKLFIPVHQAKEYELPEELFSWQEMNYLLA